MGRRGEECLWKCPIDVCACVQRGEDQGGECCATRKSVAFFWVYHGNLYSREGEDGMVLGGLGDIHTQLYC